MKTLHVELDERSYPIMIDAGLLARAGRLLRDVGFRTAPVIVTNRKVLRLHGRPLLESLERAFGPVPLIRIGDGERFKDQATLASIYAGLARAKADRNSWIVAFGGGVVGDIAGFAAATYMRGIPYVGVPTTLLAQVDSSVGGKVAVNVPWGKNLVGAFHQPRAVLSDTAALRTLPPRELASGLYEVVKCGAIRSAPLLSFLEKHLDGILRCEPQAAAHAILESVRVKAAVVSADERESRLRMILNFGHTVGHALEAATGYRRFRHGEAVAWGMLAAAGLSCREGTFPGHEAGRLVRLVHRIEKLPPLRGISVSRLWQALRHDKKSRAGKISFVLLGRLGKAEIREDMDAGSVRRFLEEFIRSEGRVAPEA